MKIKSCFKKLIAAFLVFCLSFEQGAFGAPSLPAPILPVHEITQELNFFSELPADLAYVEEIWRPADETAKTAPKLFLIQDAHGHEEAQVNIEETLKYLEKYVSFGALFFEGGFGKLNPELLKFFENDKTNIEMAEALLKKGEIGGPELYVLKKNSESLKLFGVEDPKVYIENIQAYREVLSKRESTNHWLEQTHRALDKEASSKLPPELYQFIKLWLSYENESIDFTTYLSGLSKSSKERLDLDMNDSYSQFDWPMLVRLFEIKNREADLDLTLVELEKTKLLNWIQEMMPKSNMLTYLNSQDDTNTNLRQKWEMFHHEAKVEGFKYQDYPAFFKAEGLKILEEEIDAVELFKEINKLRIEIIESFAEQKHQALIEKINTLLLMKKLLNLELSFDEFKTYQKQRQHSLIDSADVEQVLQSADEFYQTALKRDLIMTQKIKEAFEKGDIQHGLLVAGGFHTAGLTALLREQGISYAVLRPHMSNVAEDKIYEETMFDKKDSWGLFSSTVRGANFLITPEAWKQQGLLLNRRSAYFSEILDHGFRHGEKINADFPIEQIGLPHEKEIKFLQSLGRSELREKSTHELEIEKLLTLENTSHWGVSRWLDQYRKIMALHFPELEDAPDPLIKIPSNKPINPNETLLEADLLSASAKPLDSLGLNLGMPDVSLAIPRPEPSREKVILTELEIKAAEIAKVRYEALIENTFRRLQRDNEDPTLAGKYLLAYLSVFNRVLKRLREDELDESLVEDAEITVTDSMKEVEQGVRQIIREAEQEKEFPTSEYSFSHVGLSKAPDYNDFDLVFTPAPILALRKAGFFAQYKGDFLSQLLTESAVPIRENSNQTFDAAFTRPIRRIVIREVPDSRYPPYLLIEFSRNIPEIGSRVIRLFLTEKAMPRTPEEEELSDQFIRSSFIHDRSVLEQFTFEADEKEDVRKEKIRYLKEVAQQKKVLLETRYYLGLEDQDLTRYADFLGRDLTNTEGQTEKEAIKIMIPRVEAFEDIMIDNIQLAGKVSPKAEGIHGALMHKLMMLQMDRVNILNHTLMQPVKQVIDNAGLLAPFYSLGLAFKVAGEGDDEAIDFLISVEEFLKFKDDLLGLVKLLYASRVDVEKQVQSVLDKMNESLESKGVDLETRREIQVAFEIEVLYRMFYEMFSQKPYLVNKENRPIFWRLLAERVEVAWGISARSSRLWLLARETFKEGKAQSQEKNWKTFMESWSADESENVMARLNMGATLFNEYNERFFAVELPPALANLTEQSLIGKLKIDKNTDSKKLLETLNGNTAKFLSDEYIAFVQSKREFIKQNLLFIEDLLAVREHYETGRYEEALAILHQYVPESAVPAMSAEALAKLTKSARRKITKGKKKKKLAVRPQDLKPILVSGLETFLKEMEVRLQQKNAEENETDDVSEPASEIPEDVVVETSPEKIFPGEGAVPAIAVVTSDSAVDGEAARGVFEEASTSTVESVTVVEESVQPVLPQTPREAFLALEGVSSYLKELLVDILEAGEVFQATGKSKLRAHHKNFFDYFLKNSQNSLNEKEKKAWALTFAAFNKGIPKKDQATNADFYGMEKYYGAAGDRLESTEAALVQPSKVILQFAMGIARILASEAATEELGVPEQARFTYQTDASIDDYIKLLKKTFQYQNYSAEYLYFPLEKEALFIPSQDQKVLDAASLLALRKIGYASTIRPQMNFIYILESLPLISVTYQNDAEGKNPSLLLSFDEESLRRVYPAVKSNEFSILLFKESLPDLPAQDEKELLETDVAFYQQFEFSAESSTLESLKKTRAIIDLVEAHKALLNYEFLVDASPAHIHAFNQSVARTLAEEWTLDHSMGIGFSTVSALRSIGKLEMRSVEERQTLENAFSEFSNLMSAFYPDSAQRLAQIKKDSIPELLQFRIMAPLMRILAAKSREGWFIPVTETRRFVSELNQLAKAVILPGLQELETRGTLKGLDDKQFAEFSLELIYAVLNQVPKKLPRDLTRKELQEEANQAAIVIFAEEVQEFKSRLSKSEEASEQKLKSDVEIKKFWNAFKSEDLTQPQAHNMQEAFEKLQAIGPVGLAIDFTDSSRFVESFTAMVKNYDNVRAVESENAFFNELIQARQWAEEGKLLEALTPIKSVLEKIGEHNERTAVQLFYDNLNKQIKIQTDRWQEIEAALELAATAGSLIELNTAKEVINQKRQGFAPVDNQGFRITELEQMISANQVKLEINRDLEEAAGNPRRQLDLAKKYRDRLYANDEENHALADKAFELLLEVGESDAFAELTKEEEIEFNIIVADVLEKMEKHDQSMLISSVDLALITSEKLPVRDLEKEELLETRLRKIDPKNKTLARRDEGKALLKDIRKQVDALMQQLSKSLADRQRDEAQLRAKIDAYKKVHGDSTKADVDLMFAELARLNLELDYKFIRSQITQAFRESKQNKDSRSFFIYKKEQWLLGLVRKFENNFQGTSIEKATELRREIQTAKNGLRDRSELRVTQQALEEAVLAFQKKFEESRFAKMLDAGLIVPAQQIEENGKVLSGGAILLVPTEVLKENVHQWFIYTELINYLKEDLKIPAEQIEFVASPFLPSKFVIPHYFQGKATQALNNNYFMLKIKNVEATDGKKETFYINPYPYFYKAFLRNKPVRSVREAELPNTLRNGFKVMPFVGKTTDFFKWVHYDEARNKLIITLEKPEDVNALPVGMLAINTAREEVYQNLQYGDKTYGIYLGVHPKEDKSIELVVEIARQSISAKGLAVEGAWRHSLHVPVDQKSVRSMQRLLRGYRAKGFFDTLKRNSEQKRFPQGFYYFDRMEKFDDDIKNQELVQEGEELLYHLVNNFLSSLLNRTPTQVMHVLSGRERKHVEEMIFELSPANPIAHIPHWVEDQDLNAEPMHPGQKYSSVSDLTSHWASGRAKDTRFAESELNRPLLADRPYSQRTDYRVEFSPHVSGEKSRVFMLTQQRDPFAAKPRHPHRVLASILKMDLEQEQIEMLFTLPTDEVGHALVSIARKKADGSFEKFQMNEKTKSVYLRSGRNEKLYIIDERPKGNIIELSDMDFNNYGNISYRMQSRWLAGAQASGILASLLAEDTIQKQYDELVKTLEATALAPWKEKLLEAMEGAHESLDALNEVIKGIAATRKVDDSEINLLTGMAFSVSRKHALHQLVYEKDSAEDHPMAALLRDIDRHDQTKNPLSAKQTESREKIRRLNLEFHREKPSLYGVSSQALAVLYAARKSLYHIPSVDRKIESLSSFFQEWRDPLVEELNYLLEAAHSKDLIHQIEAVRFMLNSDFIPADVAFFEAMSRALTIGRFEETEEKRSELRMTEDKKESDEKKIETWREQIQFLVELGILPKAGEGDVISFLNGAEANLFEFVSGVGTEARADMKLENQLDGITTILNDLGVDFQEAQVRKNYKGTIISSFEDVDGFMAELRTRKDLNPIAVVLKFSEDYFVEYKTHDSTLHLYDLYEAGEISDEKFSEEFNRFKREAGLEYIRLLNRYLEALQKEYGPISVIVIEDSPKAYEYLKFPLPIPMSSTRRNFFEQRKDDVLPLLLDHGSSSYDSWRKKMGGRERLKISSGNALELGLGGYLKAYYLGLDFEAHVLELLRQQTVKHFSDFDQKAASEVALDEADRFIRRMNPTAPFKERINFIVNAVRTLGIDKPINQFYTQSIGWLLGLIFAASVAAEFGLASMAVTYYLNLKNLGELISYSSAFYIVALSMFSFFATLMSAFYVPSILYRAQTNFRGIDLFFPNALFHLAHRHPRALGILAHEWVHFVSAEFNGNSPTAIVQNDVITSAVQVLVEKEIRDELGTQDVEGESEDLRLKSWIHLLDLFWTGGREITRERNIQKGYQAMSEHLKLHEQTLSDATLKSFRKMVREGKSHWNDFRGFQVVQMVLRIFFTLGFYSPENYALSYRIGGMALALSEDDPTNDRAWEFLRQIGLGQSVAESYVNLFEKSRSVAAPHFTQREPRSSDRYSQDRSELRHIIGGAHDLIERYTGIAAISILTVLFWQPILSFVTAYYLSLIIAVGILGVTSFIRRSFQKTLLADYDERLSAVDKKVEAFKQELKVADTVRDIRKLRDRTYQSYQAEFPLKKAETREQVRSLFDLLGSLSGSGLTAKQRSERIAEGLESILGIRLLMAQRDVMRRKGFSEVEIEKLHAKTFPRYSFTAWLTRFPGRVFWFFLSAPFRSLNYFLEQARSKIKVNAKTVNPQSLPEKVVERVKQPIATVAKAAAKRAMEVVPALKQADVQVIGVEKPRSEKLSPAEEKAEEFMKDVFRRKMLLFASSSEKAATSSAAEAVLQTFETEMRSEQGVYESSMSQRIRAAFKTLISQHPEVNAFRLKLQDRVNELKSQETARESLPLELEQIISRMKDDLTAGKMQSGDVATDQRVATFRQSVEQSRLPDSERSTWISKLEGLVNEVGRVALQKEQIEYQRKVERRLEFLETSLTERIQDLSITKEEILNHPKVLEAREAIKNPLLTADLQQNYQQKLDKLVESLVAALAEKPRENIRKKLNALVLRAGEDLRARIATDNITAEEIHNNSAILEFDTLIAADGEASILTDQERAGFQGKMAELMDSLITARALVLHHRAIDLLTSAYAVLDSNLTQKVEAIHLGGKLIGKDQRVMDFYGVIDGQEMLSNDEKENWKKQLANRVNDLEKRSYEILENEGQVWKAVAVNANFLQVGVQARMKDDLEYAKKYFSVLSELDFIAGITRNENIEAYVKPENEAELRHRLRVATEAVFHLADIYFEADESAQGIDFLEGQKTLIEQYFPELKAGDPLYQQVRQLETISNTHESGEESVAQIKTRKEIVSEKAVARNIIRLEKAQVTQAELDFVAWFERIESKVNEQLRGLTKFTIKDIDSIAESADIREFTKYLVFYAEAEVQETYLDKLEKLLEAETKPFRDRWQVHLDGLAAKERERLAELERQNQERLKEVAHKEQAKLFKEYKKSFDLFIESIEAQHVLYREGSKFMDAQAVEEFKEKIKSSHLSDENKKYYLETLEKTLNYLVKEWLTEELVVLIGKIESQMEFFRTPEQLMDVSQEYRERVIASPLNGEAQKILLEDLDQQLDPLARRVWEEMSVSAKNELNGNYPLKREIEELLREADESLKLAIAKSGSDKGTTLQKAQEKYGEMLLRLDNATIQNVPEFAKRFLLVRIHIGLSKSLRYSRFEPNAVDRAMANIDEALVSVDPWNDDLLEEKAAILLFKAQAFISGRQSNVDQAIEKFSAAQNILEPMVLRHPTSRSIHGMLIEIYLGLGDDEKLLRLIQKIREANILDLDRQRSAEKIKEVERMQSLIQEGRAIKLKAKDVVKRQPKLNFHAYPNIFRAVLEIPSEKLLFLVDTETGNFVNLGKDSYVRLYQSFSIHKDRLAVQYTDGSIALFNVRTGKAIALQKPKAVVLFLQHTDIQVSEFLFKDSKEVMNQSGELWVQYTSKALGAFVVLRYNAQNGNLTQEDPTQEALRRRSAVDAPYIRYENFPWLYFFEGNYFVAKGERSELRLAPEASLSGDTYFETYQADIVATAEDVTNSIYAFVNGGRLRDLIQTQYAFAAEPVNLDLSSQEEALIVSNYRKLFSNQAQIVVPAQILQSLSKEGRQKFFDLLIRGIGNTDVNLLPMIYFAGEGADMLKKEFYTYSFFRDNPAINRVLKVQLQSEITIANRLKNKAVSVSVAKATTEALEAEIPGLFVKKQGVLEIKNESDRVRLLTNLVQLQLLVATEIKEQLASGQERTKLFGALLKKIGMEYSITSEGFIQPSLPSLVSGVLAQYLDSQRAISTAA